MKIKVGDKVYDGAKEPIMVILTQKDKENITNMDPEATKYCEFPGEYTEDIKSFMKTD